MSDVKMLGEALDVIIDDGVAAANDAEFCAVWQLMEAKGYQWSEGNVEKAHLGWLLARAALQAQDVAINLHGALAVIPEGMVPWYGGNRPPEDWNGDSFAHRDGTIWEGQAASRWIEGITAGRAWQHDGLAGDIIAYTPRSAQAEPPMCEALRGAIKRLQFGADFQRGYGADMFMIRREDADQILAVLMKRQSA